MQDVLIFIAIGIAALTLLWIFRRNTTSTFTFQPFENLKNAQEVTASFKTQSQQIATELQAELVKAKTENKSKEEMIKIADKFSDYSCDMSKAFSRWNINNSM
jgi:high-affinity Fe2+/Pb2+ permease